MSYERGSPGPLQTVSLSTRRQISPAATSECVELYAPPSEVRVENITSCRHPRHGSYETRSICSSCSAPVAEQLQQDCEQVDEVEIERQRAHDCLAAGIRCLVVERLGQILDGVPFALSDLVPVKLIRPEGSSRLPCQPREK